MAREEKYWLTPARLARGPEKADEELRRWAGTSFRRASLKGDLAAIRAEDRARQAERLVGAYVTARDVGDETQVERLREPATAALGDVAYAPARKPTRGGVTVGQVAVGAALVVGGFFLGRWARRAWQVRSGARAPALAPAAHVLGGDLQEEYAAYPAIAAYLGKYPHAKHTVDAEIERFLQANPNAPDFASIDEVNRAYRAWLVRAHPPGLEGLYALAAFA